MMSFAVYSTVLTHVYNSVIVYQVEVEDASMLQAVIQEKESLITQLTVEVEHLHTEVTDISDFQVDSLIHYRGESK